MPDLKHESKCTVQDTTTPSCCARHAMFKLDKSLCGQLSRAVLQHAPAEPFKSKDANGLWIVKSSNADDDKLNMLPRCCAPHRALWFLDQELDGCLSAYSLVVVKGAGG